MPEARGSIAPVVHRVGRYDVLLPIASGGMATVYLARSRGVGGFERDVALKLTHAHLAESAEFARDLLEEAKIAVGIRHANVVPVLDVGEDPNGLFLVMEYIEGDTLSGLMRRAKSSAAGGAAPLAPGIAFRVLLDALGGLHAAHELADEEGRNIGLVHRDFSPQNILVGSDGVGRLTDFGIAKAASRLGATRTGAVKGKVNYMAPEQARGEQLDRRTDVWAAGVVAWELLAGRRMYDGDELGTLFRIASDTPPRVRDVVESVHPALDAAVARALTRDLSARTPTAAAFAKDLTQALREASIELADASDVAAVVKQLVGNKIAERRKRVREVIELRQALEDAARASADSLTPGTGLVPPKPAATVAMPPPARVDLPSFEPLADPPATDVTSASASIPLSPPPRRVGLAALAAAGVVAVLILVTALVKSRAPASAAEPSRPPAAATTAMPQTTLTADPAPPAPTTEASAPPVAATASASSTAEAPAARPIRPTAPAAPRPPPAKKPAPSLLDQQY
jgi:serine/threonine-protein kinase